MLLRKAYRIMVKLFDNDQHHVGNAASILASILMKRGKLGDETKELLERHLAMTVWNEGLDGCINIPLSKRQQTVDIRNEHLYLAMPYHKEVVRINSKRFGPADVRTVEYTSLLTDITLDLLSEEVVYI